MTLRNTKVFSPVSKEGNEFGSKHTLMGLVGSCHIYLADRVEKRRYSEIKRYIAKMKKGYTKFCDDAKMKIEYNEDGIDEVVDVIDAMIGRQMHFTDEDGILVDVPSPMDRIIMLDFASKEWIECVSQHMSVQCEYRYGELQRVRLENRHGTVILTESEIVFEGGRIALAKKILDAGIVARYIKYPDLADAMHVLHCMDGDQYYDLIELPSGGHVPVPHLVAMHVGWETLAKIPLGKPRGDDFFSCPVCRKKSFYSGVCTECQLALPEERLHEFTVDLAKRKEQEKDELWMILKSSDWTGCRYVRTAEQSA